MKIGVDGVLLGAWARIPARGRVLDAGTGCGLIALMAAQRSPTILIDALDTDTSSADEARQNFEASPWADRLSAINSDFRCAAGAPYSLIISNPPFFDSGADAGTDSRMAARHAASLGPVSLISDGAGMLAPDGRIALVCPPSWLAPIAEAAAEEGMEISRATFVSGTQRAKPKRVLLELCRAGKIRAVAIRHLAIESSPGQHTETYRRITRKFYLKF